MTRDTDCGTLRQQCANIVGRESEQTSGMVWITREQGEPTKVTKQQTACSQEQSGAANHIQDIDASELVWDEIDWPAIEREVNRLQARIVKAEQESRWNKVKALQHLLTRSRAAKLLAVRRVTENKGSRTPGVDGHT